MWIEVSKEELQHIIVALQYDATSAPHLYPPLAEKLRELADRLTEALKKGRKP
uniref:Uncharacterized protein n=1 Tax=viral metagenome TaxID=1070528 RepID=A0A6H1ZXZ5_9ZZZZ